ncbi:MAG: phage Gp37/Gp68 family protein [Acaryochloridaceae cyanobacterium RU_4_10]|nr:phage Gp37/Gp68 family protein [Acaryochloridaceae cyanobacterium RU_4_10]
MSSIEWTDETWNPFVGCSKISPGCTNCYAINQAYRNNAMAQKMPNPGRMKYYEGLTDKKGDRIEWTGIVRFVPEALEIPLKWKKPRRIFVNSMSDLFHESIPFEQVDQVFGVMALTPQHTYQILTKRPGRMLEYMNQLKGVRLRAGLMRSRMGGYLPEIRYPKDSDECLFPLKNVILGCTIENQKAVSDRTRYLYNLHKMGWKTFYSVEPLLEAVDLHMEASAPNWIIIGGESGPGARPFHLEWARSLIQQCRDAGVVPFMKQLGSNPYENGQPLKLHSRKGAHPREWPEELRIQEFPV